MRETQRETDSQRQSSTFVPKNAQHQVEMKALR